MAVVTHIYHLVDKRPWPLFRGIGAWIMTFGLVRLFVGIGDVLIIYGLFFIFLVVFQWWRDVVREGLYLGIHVNFVVVGLKYGIILFIVSEVFFFISFFWAFFHSRLSPTFEVGSYWPPVGVEVFNPFQIPLLNTSLLLSSGVRVTWAHHSLIEGDWNGGFFGLLITVVLGLYFTLLQGYEYYEAFFNISDSIYGSIFYIATGFHGFHVIIGSVFLLVCLFRHYFEHFSLTHHFGFEAAAWYWHFVDVVWLFLYIMVYWWGG